MRNPVFVGLDFFQRGLCPFAVGPEIGIQRELFLFFELYPASGDVKDTSLIHPRGSVGYYTDLRS